MKRIMLFLLALLSPIGLEGQDRSRPPERDMVMENGEWKTPTPAAALRAVEMLTVDMLDLSVGFASVYGVQAAASGIPRLNSMSTPRRAGGPGAAAASGSGGS
ncbi:hypothetical protein [Candidatus Palauibacter sp.]|uniref:hypothetical protein n=1 Tax=Candidatus Palauibacter sp. TaxID=3101350 RepID=UPI003B51C73A